MRVETSGRGGPHPSRLRQRHLVRPRYVWGGLVAAIVGSVALGAGIAILSWTLAVMGALFLTGGATSGELVVVCAITAWLSPDADAGVEEPMNRAL